MAEHTANRAEIPHAAVAGIATTDASQNSAEALEQAIALLDELVKQQLTKRDATQLLRLLPGIRVAR